MNRNMEMLSQFIRESIKVFGFYRTNTELFFNASKWPSILAGIKVEHVLIENAKTKTYAKQLA